MRYTLIAAAMIGAVVAMPAAPASYGEAPAAYAGSEDVYGTQVSNQQTTTAAAIASSTCTDEAENIVPYTSAVAQSQVMESSAPAYGVPGASMTGEGSNVPAMQTGSGSSSGSMASPNMPAETPAGYASASKPADMASSSMVSAEGSKPAETMPAGYASSMGGASSMMSGDSPKDVASATEVSPVESAPAGYMASSAVPNSPESTMPATEGSTESSPEMPAPYGSAVVPGSAPTAAPYPVGGESPASPVGTGVAAASGTIGAAKPTGTGSVTGGTTEFEGAASSITAAGLFVSFGAIAALFM